VRGERLLVRVSVEMKKPPNTDGIGGEVWAMGPNTRGNVGHADWLRDRSIGIRRLAHPHRSVSSSRAETLMAWRWRSSKVPHSVIEACALAPRSPVDSRGELALLCGTCRWPRPKTEWPITLFSRVMFGFGVRDPAMPIPIPGIISGAYRLRHQSRL
jgi:hypothetical protein